MSNPNAVYVLWHAAPQPKTYVCSLCSGKFSADKFVEHRKRCVSDAMIFWDADEYSKKYFQQVRAMSRFRQPGEAKRRNKYRAWAWWAAVRPDGPPLVRAEVS